MKILENYDLINNNTYRVSCICKYFVIPDSLDDLKEILEKVKKEKAKYLILGGGSNILFASSKYDGYVITLKNLNKYKVLDDGFIETEAGSYLAVIAKEALNKGLKGLEWSLGIPGTIGGSVSGNAGAYLSDIFSVLDTITYLDENLELVTKKAENIKHEYRHTEIKEHPWIIVKVTMKLTKGDKKELEELAEDRALRRKNSQPLEYPNAGSVFRNPEGLFAGKLIEDLNLKGYNIGGAKVSEKHANFIINYNKATGEDIAKLITYVKDKVKEAYNIDLKVEQIIERD